MNLGDILKTQTTQIYFPSSYVSSFISPLLSSIQFKVNPIYHHTKRKATFL